MSLRDIDRIERYGVNITGSTSGLPGFPSSFGTGNGGAPAEPLGDLPPVAPPLSPRGSRDGTQGGKTHMVTILAPEDHMVEVRQVNYPAQGHNLANWTLSDGHPAVRRIRDDGKWEVRTRARVKNNPGDWKSTDVALLRITLIAPDGSKRHFPESVVAADDSYFATLTEQGRFFYPGDAKPLKVGSTTTKNYASKRADDPSTGSSGPSVGTTHNAPGGATGEVLDDLGVEVPQEDESTSGDDYESTPGDDYITPYESDLDQPVPGLPLWGKVAAGVGAAVVLVGGTVLLTRRGGGRSGPGGQYRG